MEFIKEQISNVIANPPGAEVAMACESKSLLRPDTCPPVHVPGLAMTSEIKACHYQSKEKAGRIINEKPATGARIDLIHKLFSNVIAGPVFGQDVAVCLRKQVIASPRYVPPLFMYRGLQ